MADPGILTVTFDVQPAGEALINRWYDEEHVGDRLRIEKFRDVRRYRSVDGGRLRHMTVWEVDDAAWPFDPVYRAIPMDSWSSIIGDFRGRSTRAGWVELPVGVPRKPDPGSADPKPGLRAVAMEIPPEHQQDFHDWYEQDHIPQLMERPEYLGIRRFRALDGSAFLALWELTDVGLHTRPDHVPAQLTPWTERVAAYRLSVQHATWERIAIAHRPDEPGHRPADAAADGAAR